MPTEEDPQSVAKEGTLHVEEVFETIQKVSENGKKFHAWSKDLHAVQKSELEEEEKKVQALKKQREIDRQNQAEQWQRADEQQRKQDEEAQKLFDQLELKRKKVLGKEQSFNGKEPPLINLKNEITLNELVESRLAYMQCQQNNMENNSQWPCETCSQ